MQVTNLTDAVADFVEAVHVSGGLPFRFINAYSLALADRDAAYRAVLSGAGVSLPDGSPVAAVIRWKARHRTRHAGQVRGPSFFAGVLSAGRSNGLRHFFLGGSASSLTRLVEVVGQRYPGIEIAGSWAPPFAPVDDEMLRSAASRILAARPDLVWISLGTPKQDFAAARLAPIVGVPVAAVGAAFDYESGTVREAPGFVRRLGFEWLFRFVTEPRRLWRRYVFGNVRFLLAVARSELHPPERGRRSAS